MIRFGERRSDEPQRSLQISRLSSLFLRSVSMGTGLPSCACDATKFLDMRQAPNLFAVAQ